jgi:predicted nuclease with TOPRIM domain
MTENNNVKCDEHCYITNMVKKHDGDIDDLYNKYNEIDKKQSVFNERILIFCEAMKDVPKNLIEIKESNKVTQDKVEGLTSDMEIIKNKVSSIDNDRFEKIEKKVDNIDNESKVNTRTWFRDNFVKVAGVVIFGTLVLSAIATYIISKII